eukprot:TRINITY_DN2292_c0_g1_i1.p1 TRINITY_DN2292_c0_g1~~TRINITY_DN2292_c0_g1_i1.p1  ORF type:complete len:376 (-),score=93.28 TRINITY_DN2292_c0_g1_i1:118-1245(-)
MEAEHVEEIEYQEEDLISRLSAYTVVNSLYQGYNNVKERNTYLKAGLQTAENLTTPVLKKLDHTLNLDQRGVQLLDKIENTATKVTDYYQTTKDNAVETGKTILSNANKPMNQLLDVTEELVNKILPATNILEEEDLSGSGELPEGGLRGENGHGDANPLPRMKELGTDVTKRLQTVAICQIQNAQRSNSFAYVVDLIQFAAEKTRLIKENATLVFEDKKEVATEKLVNPVKEIIEQQTSDIKSTGQKAVIAVVSTIAHAAQVVRKQIANNVPETAVLQENLIRITRKTKDAVLKLNEEELAKYMVIVRETCGLALHSIVELTSYIPAGIFPNIPLVAQLMPMLSSWKLSFTTRFALENEAKKEKKDENTEEEII